MVFTNKNFLDKYFYAFINKAEYVNPNTTFLYFQLDVMQTWLGDLKIDNSLIEREHVEDDSLYANLEDEGIQVQERLPYDASYNFEPYIGRKMLVIGATESYESIKNSYSQISYNPSVDYPKINVFDWDYDISVINDKNYFDIDLNYTYSDGILEFRLADYLNTGFILDDIKLGNYEVFLKTTKEETEKYYILDNKTEYKNTVYYTLSKDDKYNKITITNAERYNTLAFNVSATNDEAYDIVLDPGHGGNDSGACLRDICETRYTLNFANTLKKQLENAGFRVKLTRDTDTTLKTYGTNSRTGIPYEAHAKYLISLHMNAGANYSGFELYTSNHIDYTLANRIATNLSNINEFQSSPSTFNRVTPNGIFTRTMGDKELEEFVTDAIENNYEKYSVSKETNYYYMIRETGGYMSGAYVDGREGNRNNPYVKSNVGSESYILELGYITSEHDLNLIDHHNTEYLQAVSDAISSYLLHK